MSVESLVILHTVLVTPKSSVVLSLPLATWPVKTPLQTLATEHKSCPIRSAGESGQMLRSRVPWIVSKLEVGFLSFQILKS